KILDPYDECKVHNNSTLAGTRVSGPDGPPTGTASTQYVSSELLDQCSSSYFVGSPIPTTLQFTMFEPTDQLAEATKTSVAPNGIDQPADNSWTLTTANLTDGGTFYGNTQTFGKD